MDKRISQRRLTLEKRKQQTCKVYEIKIDKSHLSKQSLRFLSSLLKEAKWFYNFCLSHDDVDTADTSIKEVPVKVQDEFEIRKFHVLQAQMKQAIKTRLFNNLVSLSKLKKNGHKVGKLKFKSYIDSIPLKQFNKTYFLDLNENKIKIQGMKKTWLRVNGLDQIPENVEFANATLIQKSDNFYLNVTTYQEKQELDAPEACIGIDFGCETQLSFSNGIKVKFEVPVNKRIRRLDRKIMRKRRKNSKNKAKDQSKRRKAYEKLVNQKKDIRNKVVNAITTCFKYVCVQNESIKAWQAGNHGKKITNTAIGGIMSDLKHKSHTPIVVDKFFPSTQLCPKCSKKNKLELSERVYSCECGYMNDRDIKSAICIMNEGMKQIPMDCREFTLEEISTSAFFDKLNKIGLFEVSKLES